MIKIYGTDWCGYCLKAKRLAIKEKLEFEFIDKEENEEEFSKLFPQALTIPQILVNDKHIGGYEEFKDGVDNGQI